MVMSKDEIIVRYKQAKEPAKQIGILADLNCCTKEEIAEVLREAGYKLKVYKKVETPEAAMQQPETPEETKLTALPGKQLALEDALDIMIGALEDLRDVPEGVNRGEAAAAAIAYMSGAADMFKALHGPIVR